MWAALAVVFAFVVLAFVTTINFLVEHWYIAGPAGIALFAVCVVGMTARSARLRPVGARR